MKYKSAFLVLFVMFYLTFNSSSQCPNFSWYPTTVPASCSGVTVINGMVLSGGTTYFQNGISNFPLGLTLNSSSLIICGNLTVSSLNIIDNVGVYIYVRPGASLTINSNVILPRNVFIVNYGNLTINGNCTMTPYAAYIYNSINGVFNMPNTGNTLSVSGSSWFVNIGLANVYQLTTTSSATEGCLCLGSGSVLNTYYFTNDFYNSIDVLGVSPVCISVNNQLTLTNSLLTNEPLVDICEPISANNIMVFGGSLGSANLIQPCTSCSVLLGSDHVDFFESKNIHGMNCLRIHVNDEKLIDKYIIEKSNNDLIFFEVLSFESNDTDGGAEYEFCDDVNMSLENGYYKLKVVGFNKEIIDEKYVFLNSNNENNVFYNSNSHLISFNFSTINFPMEVNVFNVSGQQILNKTINSEKESIFFSNVITGIYFVNLKSSSIDFTSKIFVN